MLLQYAENAISFKVIKIKVGPDRSKTQSNSSGAWSTKVAVEEIQEVHTYKNKFYIVHKRYVYSTEINTVICQFL